MRKLAAAFRRQGAKVGDDCRLTFDVNERSVQIEIVAGAAGGEFT